MENSVLEALASDSRMAFLLALGHRLGIAARELYADPATVDAAQARACNEMMISVFSQAWATDDRAVAGYPDADFLSILVGKADAGNARGLLRNAIVSAQRYRDAS